MQLWTTEMWQAASIGLIIGMLIGYLIVRFTKGSIKHQMQTKTELKNVKAQLEAQNVQLEKHFAESAELFKTLIGDYQKLYRHYAHSSDTLLGKNPKGLFTQQLITAADKPQEEPPRDYSEGSSGLFKPNEEKA